MDTALQPSPESKEEFTQLLISFFLQLKDKLGLDACDIYAAAARIRQLENDRVARFSIQYTGSKMTLDEAREAAEKFR